MSNYKMYKSILILDYSTLKDEAPVIKKYLPEDIPATVLEVNSSSPFPGGFLLQKGFTHVIHTGSALSILEESAFTSGAVDFICQACIMGIAQFGICYGHQLICLALVGKNSIRSSPNGLEAGWCPVNFYDVDGQIPGCSNTERVWQSHFDEVVLLPEDSKLLAENEHTKIQAYRNDRLKLLATQFHPEFNKMDGDRLFRKDRLLLEKNQYNPDDILASGPTIPTGQLFFSYFLESIFT